MRTSGVLLNISSLPNNFGIGGFGVEAEEFAKFLKKSGCAYWQILPITTIGEGNSPYSGFSAFAGNPLYIDPNTMFKDKLISKEELEKAVYNGNEFTVDYDFVKSSKRKLIESVANKMINDKSVETFKVKNSYWLDDYALFMAIKETFAFKAWFCWKDEYKFKIATTMDEFKKNNAEKINYYIVEQFLFDSQWKRVKENINKSGIKIIGDMPIYVAHDSVDVWSNPQNFLLDENLKPTIVAGVPPDYFCKQGQLWGNPIYNYPQMLKDHYIWFETRFGRMFEMYDTLRVDHFRAFDRYWAVDANAQNAISGKWINGCGKELFKVIQNKYPNNNIIAEDLGQIDDGVIALKNSLNLPGMHVLQFGFDDYNSSHMPHNYTKNSVAYTGTHDNNTLFGWLYEVSVDVKKRMYEYLGLQDGLQGGKNSEQVWGCIRAVLTSVADTAIIPFQDLCGWGADTRMNIPGVAHNNWRIRINSDAINTVNTQKFLNLNILSARNV